MRLIDADKLKKAIENAKGDYAHNTNLIGVHSVKQREMDFKGILQIIESFETVDVEPVRHGNWVYDYDCDCIKCSFCGEYDALSRDDYSYRGGKIRDNHSAFCPNCGAKMDLEESE